jgi:hypothetical protein
MMRGPVTLLRTLARDRGGNAAAEMALALPLLLVLMFSTAELGNYFLDQHAVTKQVRDGARFASRLTLAEPYSCTAGGAAASGVYEAADADTQIINVTKTGSTDGSATGRFPAAFWTQCGTDPVVQVEMRCVDKDLYGGIYAGLDGDVPVVKVKADVAYPSLFGTLGMDTTALCLRAESESAVAGI